MNLEMIDSFYIIPILLCSILFFWLFFYFFKGSKENDSCKNCVKYLKQCNNENNECRIENRELNNSGPISDTSFRGESVCELKEEIERLQEEFNRLENVKTESDDLVALKETENTDLKSELSALQSNLSLCKEDLREAVGDRDKIRREFEQINADRNLDDNCHVKMYKKYEDKIEKLKYNAMMNKEKIMTLDRGLKESVKEMENLKKRCEEREKEINVKGQDNVKLAKEVEDLENMLSVKESDLKNVQKELERVTEMSRDYEELKNSSAKNGQEIVNLNRELKDAMKEKEDLSQMCDEAKRSLVEKVEQLSKFSEDNGFLRKDIEELKKEIVGKSEDFLRSKDEMRDSNSKLKEIIGTLGNTIEMKVSDINGLRTRESILQRSVDDLIKQLNKKEEELIANDKENSARAELYNGMRDDNVKLREEIKSLEIHNLRGNESVIGERLSSLNDRVHGLDNSLVMDEHRRMENGVEVMGVTENVEEVVAEIENVEEEITIINGSILEENSPQQILSQEKELNGETVEMDDSVNDNGDFGGQIVDEEIIPENARELKNWKSEIGHLEDESKQSRDTIVCQHETESKTNEWVNKECIDLDEEWIQGDVNKADNEEENVLNDIDRSQRTDIKEFRNNLKGTQSSLEKNEGDVPPAFVSFGKNCSEQSITEVKEEMIENCTESTSPIQISVLLEKDALSSKITIKDRKKKKKNQKNRLEKQKTQKN